MQSLVTNSVGAVCAAVIVPVYERGLRSMKGLRSGVCKYVAVPGRTVALGRNREGWAGTWKVGGRRLRSHRPVLCRARPHVRVSMPRGAPRQQRGCARAHT